MRVLISGGGTGGHVYPALAVIEQLKQAHPSRDELPEQKQQQNNEQQRQQESPPPEDPAAALAQPPVNPALADPALVHPEPESPILEELAEGKVLPPEAEPEAEPIVKPVASPKPGLESETELQPSPNESWQGESWQGDTQLLWIGAEAGMEQALVEREGIDFRPIETGQIRGINPLRAVGNLIRMVRGFAQSRSIISQFQPDVCLVTGGYVCVPVALACRLSGIPILVYLPDMSPGVAIRTVSYLAQRVAVTFAEVAHYFGGLYPQGKAVVTGYPVRETLVKASLDRGNARHQLMRSLRKNWQRRWQNESGNQVPGAEKFASFESSELPLTLIWGGSQGARSINSATWSQLDEILENTLLLHVIGNRDWPLFLEEQVAQLSGLPDELQERYYPVAYLHDEMSLALAGADLTVSRAGASTLGEFPVARLPSILVPLPYKGVAQERNAEMLASRNGAVMIHDEILKVALAPTIHDLLADKALRQSMERSLVEVAVPDAAGNIATELLKLSC